MQTTLKQRPILRGEKHDISLKILHQAGFKTTRQAATLTKRHALTIAPRPTLHICMYAIRNKLWQYCFLKSFENKLCLQKNI